jgi:hypothetical protein
MDGVSGRVEKIRVEWQKPLQRLPLKREQLLIK